MRYKDFEEIVSKERMGRYLFACSNNTKKAMQLYRYNLILSQEMFKLISCFKVSLRNKIDIIMTAYLGQDWLRDSILPCGVFYSDRRVIGTRKIITKAYEELRRNHIYTHSRLLSQMEFGVWKYMFNNVQYRLTNRLLLRAFPNKPRSSIRCRYDNTYIFNELSVVNDIRNRIAHHEPVCFGTVVGVSTAKVLICYEKMIRLLEWMDIDSHSLFYGLDHVHNACEMIENMSKILF